MDSTHYRLVFDMAASYSPNLYWRDVVVTAVALLIVAFLVVILSRHMPLRRFLIVTTVAILGFVSFVALSAAIRANEFRTLAAHLASGSYGVVEGKVERFSAGNGHVPETFSVAGHDFSVRSAVLSVAYHLDATTGGFIQSGEQVRITEVEGKIVRLEVAP